MITIKDTEFVYEIHAVNQMVEDDLKKVIEKSGDFVGFSVAENGGFILLYKERSIGIPATSVEFLVMTPTEFTTTRNKILRRLSSIKRTKPPQDLNSGEPKQVP